MEESTEKIKKKIKKYGYYAFTKNLTENGLGLIVFDYTDENVSGIILRVGKSDYFNYKMLKFETMLVYNIIEYVELLPKTVWKEFYKTYKNQLT